MPGFVIVAEKDSDPKQRLPGLPVLTAREYLEDAGEADHGTLRVINLCRSLRYGTIGYYCSLLAEARGHRVIPTVRTIQDLGQRALHSLDTADLDKLVDRVLRRPGAAPPEEEPAPTSITVTVLFGRADVPELAEFGRQVFDTIRAPLLQVELKRNGVWRIAAIRPLSLAGLTSGQDALLVDALQDYARRPWRRPRTASASRYDLAILHDPAEALPPSNRRALQEFVKAARTVGLAAELIERRDYQRLLEYDALFIRETTAIGHHTWEFSKRADAEGMVVLDDPQSILRCTNKVYLAELLRANKVPAPRSVIVRRDTLADLEAQLAYPIVLKIPDGSFSRGVHKAENRADLEAVAKQLFRDSDLILAQEFVPTAFDWRVGVLDRQPIFVCQYFMSKHHWQIVDHRGARPKEGDSRTLAVADAPPAVLRAALKAANLIGDGLYGVDCKETERGVLVIEVNDNPNIDAGVEDEVLGPELYRTIMADFVRRLDAIRQSRAAEPAEERPNTTRSR